MRGGAVSVCLSVAHSSSFWEEFEEAAMWMDGWGFASFKVIIGFHREGRMGSHAGSRPNFNF